MGLGHLCFVIGAQPIVARQSGPAEQDRNFGHFTIGASLGQLIGPIAAGYLISERDGAMARTSALALIVAAAVATVSLGPLRRIEHRSAPAARRAEPAAKVPVGRVLRARGVPAGIFISLAVLSATDILTAYLPVVGEHRGIAPATIGLLLSLRAAATIACRLVMTPMLRALGRTALLTTTCLPAGVLCAGIALPVPVAVLAAMLAVLGFCLGVGQPLSMTTVVRAAPPEARSAALAPPPHREPPGAGRGPRLGRTDRRGGGHRGPLRHARCPPPHGLGARRTGGRRDRRAGAAPAVPAPRPPRRPTDRHRA